MARDSLLLWDAYAQAVLRCVILLPGLRGQRHQVEHTMTGREAASGQRRLDDSVLVRQERGKAKVLYALLW